jgi:hypothetical protein
MLGTNWRTQEQVSSISFSAQMWFQRFCLSIQVAQGVMGRRVGQIQIVPVIFTFRDFHLFFFHFSFDSVLVLDVFVIVVKTRTHLTTKNGVC